MMYGIGAAPSLFIFLNGCLPARKRQMRRYRRSCAYKKWEDDRRSGWPKTGIIDDIRLIEYAESDYPACFTIASEVYEKNINLIFLQPDKPSQAGKCNDFKLLL